MQGTNRTLVNPPVSSRDAFAEIDARNARAAEQDIERRERPRFRVHRAALRRRAHGATPRLFDQSFSLERTPVLALRPPSRGDAREHVHGRAIALAENTEHAQHLPRACLDRAGGPLGRGCRFRARWRQGRDGSRSSFDRIAHALVHLAQSILLVVIYILVQDIRQRLR